MIWWSESKGLWEGFIDVNQKFIFERKNWTKKTSNCVFQFCSGYDNNRPDSYPYGLFRCYSGQCYIDPYDFRYNGDAVTARPICAFAKGKCSISGEYNWSLCRNQKAASNVMVNDMPSDCNWCVSGDQPIRNSFVTSMIIILYNHNINLRANVWKDNLLKNIRYFLNKTPRYLEAIF